MVNTLKPIPGFPGYSITKDGRVWSEKTNRWKQMQYATGSFFYLLRVAGRQTCRNIGRLVLEAWRGLCLPGFECCHNDGDPANNNLDNLRWDTHRANALDMVKHGRAGRGSNLGFSYNRGTANASSKLTEGQVSAIRILAAESNLTYTDIGHRFDVTGEMVSHVVRRLNWRYIK